MRILLAKGGLDGHNRGVRVLALALRDAGFEVVYLGMRVTPEVLVSSAIQEDVDVIGISLLSGAHMEYTARVMEILKKEGVKNDFKTIVGGLIPDEDIPALSSLGVAKVVQVGSNLEEVITYLKGLEA